MKKKEKWGIIFVVLIMVSYLLFAPFYNAFNYYPTTEQISDDWPSDSFKDLAIAKAGQFITVMLNHRVSLNAQVPVLPADQLPILQEKGYSSILYVDFVTSDKDFNDSTNNISFLVKNQEITKTRLNYAELYTSEQTTINNSSDYIIYKVKNGEFVTDRGDKPMSRLGRVKIVNVEFVYFNGFESYPYEYTGETTYYPAWKITAKTSNYGEETILIKA